MTKFPANFSAPVTKLVALGEKGTQSSWLDYQDHGITSEHISELNRIIQEIDQFWPTGDTESPEVSAPIHAWRALGQLKATEAIPVLIELVVFNEELESDWIMEEIPKVMGMIGSVCIPSLGDYLQLPERKTWACVTVSHSLAEVGKQNPDSRNDCIAALQSGLEQYADNDDTINAFLISYLADLKAKEAAPLVERAYQADVVDLAVMGDFEEYQIAVGLLGKRLTPPPRYGVYDDMPGLNGRPTRKLVRQKNAANASRRRKRKRSVNRPKEPVGRRENANDQRIRNHRSTPLELLQRIKR